MQRLANYSETEVLNWEKDGAYICTDTLFDPPVVKQIQYMSDEEFHCDSREMSTPAPTANPDGDTLTIVSSAVGTMIIVIVVLGTVAICYRQHHNNNKQRWFHFRRNVLSSPMSSFDFRSDKSTADDENHNGYQYDAFISFNEQDRSWVYTNLVPKLEPPKRSVDSNEPSIEKLN